jgi:hypothetical protein
MDDVRQAVGEIRNRLCLIDDEPCDPNIRRLKLPPLQFRTPDSCRADFARSSDRSRPPYGEGRRYGRLPNTPIAAVSLAAHRRAVVLPRRSGRVSA